MFEKCANFLIRYEGPIVDANSSQSLCFLEQIVNEFLSENCNIFILELKSIMLYFL